MKMSDLIVGVRRGVCMCVQVRGREVFMCVGGINVLEVFMCVGGIHVCWRY